MKKSIIKIEFLEDGNSKITFDDGTFTFSKGGGVYAEDGKLIYETIDLRSEILKRRTELGMTQKELATLAEVDQIAISRFETGQRTLGHDKIEKLLSILGLKMTT